MFQNSSKAGWRSKMLAALRASYMTISITIQHHEMNTFLWVTRPSDGWSYMLVVVVCILQHDNIWTF